MRDVEKNISDSNFEALGLKVASPEEILAWSYSAGSKSYGEITKAETINYRTQKPEKEGLFSEQIFGPVKDYECACGKYKGAHYKGIVCDRCGVEVTRSFVRRERMGHIKLATPVVHIWFLRSIPSRIALALDVPMAALERVIYYNSYIVTTVDEEAKKRALEEIDSEYKIKSKSWPKGKKDDLLKSRNQARLGLEMIVPKAIFSEIDYLNLSKKYGEVFVAETGSEPVRRFLEQIDLKKLESELEKEIQKKSHLKNVDKKALNRLQLIKGFLASKTRPEWMFLTVLPVLPPDLRPMVELDGGKFATSDLNDLYRRVINRNNRLKKLLEIRAPEVIIKNEKRMLQEAVDALIDNSIRKGGGATPMHSAQHRPLRSLSDILRGKQGRFRQNLLGKRVDYSGRSVIVIGPELKVDECGLPKKMALELFKPFVASELIKREIVFNPRAANRMIDEGSDVVWEILENIVKNKFVLLNRAPTLHRLSIEAFRPKLIEGLAIQLSALVTPPFNADFDGDQMAVHVPLSEEAQRESENRMLSILGLLKPSNGEPAMLPRHEMVAGIYWLTMEMPAGNDGEKSADRQSAKMFSDTQEALLAYEYKKIGLQEKIKVRVLKENNALVETTVGRIIFNEVLPAEFPFINKQLFSKDMKSITRDIIHHFNDFHKSAEILNHIKELGFYYSTLSGVSWGLTDIRVPEKKKEILAETSQKTEEIADQYEQGLLTAAEKKVLTESQWRHAVDQISELVLHTLNPTDSVYIFFNSGAKGNWSVAAQIMGMKGLVVNPLGQLIEMPISSCHQEGFNVLEYFAASHGGRKGLADTALKTSSAGYLTRRLVDVAQDILIQEKDCKTKNGLTISRKKCQEQEEDLSRKIFGRVLARNVVDQKGKVVAKSGELLDETLTKKVVDSTAEEIMVRSPITCENLNGICQKCYGADLAWRKLIDLGEAVGVVAAQSIGEPGTQLTLRTFHTGGVAQAVDITQGLPRVEEIFESQVPKGEAPMSEADGEVVEIKKINRQKFIRIKPRDKKSKVLEYVVPEIATLWVKSGDEVKKGDQLCEGHLNLKKLFSLLGKGACQEYILSEIKKVYDIAGENINDKHLEIIIRQMFSQLKITRSGDSDFIPGEIVSKKLFQAEVQRLKKAKKDLPKGSEIVMGIKNVALNSDSFLSAASFQETTKVLVRAAVEGKEDYLRGLKENVIIGRLIPVGTGFRK